LHAAEHFKPCFWQPHAASQFFMQHAHVIFSKKHFGAGSLARCMKILVAVHYWLFAIPNLSNFVLLRTTFEPDDMFDINVVLKPLLMGVSLPI